MTPGPASYLSVVDAVGKVVSEYLTEARGEPLQNFSPDVPFMDAGLDSLDMLKAGSQAANSPTLTNCRRKEQPSMTDTPGQN